MSYNPIPPLEELYRTPSHYGEREKAEPIYSYGPVLPWPPASYFEKFKLDAALLKEALSPCPSQRSRTLAEQVFGSQARQQKIGLGHLANVLYERALLHHRHLRDIDWRLVDCQDRLSVLKMHFPMDGGRVFRALLAEKMKFSQATKYAAYIGRIFGILMVVVGFFINPLLIIVGVFIYIGASEEAEQTIVSTTLASVRVKDVMQSEVGAVRPDQTLAEAFEVMFKNRYHDALVRLD